MAAPSSRDYVEPGIYRRPRRGNYILLLKLNGRQYTEALPCGATLRDARTRSAKLRKGARRGEVIPPMRMAVWQLFDLWLVDRAVTAKSRSMLRASRLDCCYWRETLGHFKLRQLKPSDVEAARDRLLHDLAPKTVRNALSMLRVALNWAVRHDLVQRNVAAVVKPPAVTRFESHWATPEEARRLLAVFERQGPPYGTMLALALLTCLRVESEWGGMRWRDVDLPKKTARLVRVRLQDGTVIPAGNSKHKRRPIPLSDEAVRFLEMQQAWQTQMREAKRSAWLDQEGHVFTTATGERIHQCTLKRAFERMQLEAGVPRMRVHDLRHTGATLLVLAGAHPKVVSELLRHSSIRTTLDWYSHVLPGLAESAAKALGDMLTARPSDGTGDVLGDSGQAA